MSDQVEVALRQVAERLSVVLPSLDGLSAAALAREASRQLTGSETPEPFALARSLGGTHTDPADEAWPRLVNALASVFRDASSLPWTLQAGAADRQLRLSKGGPATLTPSPGISPYFELTLQPPGEARLSSPLGGLTIGNLHVRGELGTSPSLALSLSTIEAELAPSGVLRPFVGGGIRATGSVGAVLDREGFRFASGDRTESELSASAPPLVRDLHLALADLSRIGTGGLRGFGLSCSFRTELGPFETTIERLAVPLAPTFDLIPAEGLGLRAQIPPVTGGGFLQFDPVRRQFGGVLDMSLGMIAVRAFGILATDPFSLVMVLRMEFTPAIELGLAFTLNAVGGLIGAERTINNDEFLRAAFDGRLADTLFPSDPLAQAGQILQTLDRVFPAAKGHTVVGPALRLGWGRPFSWITADLAVIIAVPAGKVAIVGQLRMAVPHEDAPLVDFRLDVFGLIDPTVGVDLGGTLRASRMGVFAVEGGMALRVHPGESEGFILSIGGFNRRYRVPAGFIAPPRLLVQISDTPLLKARFTGYVALTSGTFQIGAALEIQVGIDDFGAEGMLGFDGFIQWEPHFAFAAELYGSVAIIAFGESLMSASLRLLLEGPEPCWHASGYAAVGTFLFDVEISFDEHWACTPPRPIPAADVIALLVEEGRKPTNWSFEPPASGRAVVLRPLPLEEASVLLHPEGALRFSQRIVPLDCVVARFGAAKLAAPAVFSVAANINAAPTVPATDMFARAQFFDLNETERLTGAAFDRYVSGASLKPGGATFGDDKQEVGTRYETIAFDSPDDEAGTLHRRQNVGWHAALVALDVNAVASSTAHAQRRLRLAADGSVAPTASGVTFTHSRFAAQSARDLTEIPIPGLNEARSVDEARARFASHLAANPAQANEVRLVDRAPTGIR